MNLTAEQIEALKNGEAVWLSAPEVGQEVVVLRSDVYERVAELLDDWDPRLMRGNMAKVMEDDWNDPGMNVYDQ